MPSSESEPSDPGSPQSTQKVSFSPQSSDGYVFSPGPSQDAIDPQSPFSNGKHEAEEEESYYHSFHSNAGGDSQTHNEGEAAVFEENSHLNSGDAASGSVFDCRGAESCDRKVLEEAGPPLVAGAFDSPEESPLIPMTLYLHRVTGLVLVLLVEPHFLSDTASMEEVVRSSSNLLKTDFSHLSHFVKSESTKRKVMIL